MRDKKGVEAIGELGKILIMIVVLVLLVAGAVLLFTGKGGDILGSIKDLMRFGR